MDDLHAVEEPPRPGPAGWLAGPLRSVLLESRQRWRDMVTLAADVAFETDARGCLTFVTPDPMLGWSAGALLGRPAESLLVEATSGAAGNPLAPACVVRRQRVWLRRGDGGHPVSCSRRRRCSTGMAGWSARAALAPTSPSRTGGTRGSRLAAARRGDPRCGAAR
jgi:hypothetical protein